MNHSEILPPLFPREVLDNAKLPPSAKAWSEFLDLLQQSGYITDDEVKLMRLFEVDEWSLQKCSDLFEMPLQELISIFLNIDDRIKAFIVMLSIEKGEFPRAEIFINNILFPQAS